jgi:hypothetical protein
MTYTEFPNKLVSAANGVDYAYREAGDGGVPLVLLQHFRGNLDSWDPALIDALAPTTARSSPPTSPARRSPASASPRSPRWASTSTASSPPFSAHLTSRQANSMAQPDNPAGTPTRKDKQWFNHAPLRAKLLWTIRPGRR